MKKYLIAILLLSLSFASVSVSLEKNVFITRYGEGVTTTLNLTNLENKNTFKIIAEGMTPWLFVYPSILTLPLGGKAQIDISFSPRAPPETYLYTIKVVNAKTGETEWKGNLVFIVKSLEVREVIKNWIMIKKLKTRRLDEYFPNPGI